MYQPEDQFDNDKSLQKFQNSELNFDPSNEPKITSVDNYQAQKKQIVNLFKKLIIGGLVGGLILGIGVVILLKKLGLTDRPEPRETLPKPATEQINFLPNID
ncbi:hypothetical protein [Myxosarcina sp. GI1]|uniref:hypothetical protein n=1 Tax=Myxosarcina sp. GI1 TaxID=1541065 RepID=UPI0005682A02|nr:hypothetical protein [Myxosarcina sp. GI1]